MHEQIISLMLEKYKTESEYDKRNALKEVLQEIILVSLAKIGFFQEAAFYGGTALRMFYGLDRFSEDLDFSLKRADTLFKLEKFLPILEKEINLFGLNVSVTIKDKNKSTPIKSAFIRGNTKEYFMNFYGDGSKIAKTENIKIRMEIDLEPPQYAGFEYKEIWIPSSNNVYQILVYDEPSLFAGKIHAVLDRKWQSRVKGRDLYDYVFYLTRRKASVNLKHLIARLILSGFITEEIDYKLEDIKLMLCKKFDNIDYSQAKDDVHPFLKDASCLQHWNSKFFVNLTQELTAK